MTLRARLAIAFTVLLLAPLLAGAVALANVPIPTAGDRCRSLAVTAQGLAVTASARGQTFAVTPKGAMGPWAVCGDSSDPRPHPSLAARAEIRDRSGAVVGYAYAVQAPLAPRGRTNVVLVAAVLTALIAGTMLAWWLAGLATRPFRVLLATVGQVSAGDLAVRSRLDGRDEVGRLGRGLDELIAGMQETRRLSVTDDLTGLGNPRLLAESLRLEIERASRFGRALGVLALDLDHFKSVNDAYGHRAGDLVLAEFAARLRRAVREVDRAFRQGGEEFVILLPETDVAGSLTAARRIGEAVREVAFRIAGRHGVPDITVAVTVSIGVAVFPRHAHSGSGIIEAADLALYAAKAAGRDTFVLAGSPIPGQFAPTTVDGCVVSGGTTSRPSAAAG